MISRTVAITRNRLGESQTEFAKHFGVNQSTIQRWEKGKIKKIPPGTVKLIELVIAKLGIEFAKRQRRAAP
jgi:transcriptional regulator with XRE-family HTH domain